MEIDYSAAYKRAMELALKMQEVIPDDCQSCIIGMAAQRIACICACKLGMNLETFLNCCKYGFMATQAEMEEQKND